MAERWVVVGCAIKGIPASDPIAGEEWLAGPYATARNLRLLIDALQKGGHPKPRELVSVPGGPRVAQVFPQTQLDRLLFPRLRAYVHIAPGQPASQGHVYTPGASRRAALTLVLGGGNVSSIAPMDAIYKLFVEDSVVIVKLHPVNAALGPILEEALRPLVDEGFLAFVHGDAHTGRILANHPSVDALHLTGSDHTYDAIVWGDHAEERSRRKAANQPLNARPFSAELGCVTPILVVPGPWSAADIRYQARNVAAMVTNNASFNCNAAKVLVVARGWLQRKAFLAEVRKVLAATPPRTAYYPGALERHRAFLAHYPAAEIVGQNADGAVPWTVIPEVPPRAGEHALSTEAFCGVLAEVSLGGCDDHDPEWFLPEATRFANDACAGTLSCGLLVHPSTERDHEAALSVALRELRYGGVAVNAWPALLYALGSTTWGAYPGHTRADIQSGTGVVHNALLFDHPLKSVVRAPFRQWPKPLYFADHREADEVGRRLVAFERAPSLGAALSVAAIAVRG